MSKPIKVKKQCVICHREGHFADTHTLSLLADLAKGWYVSREDRRLTREQEIAVCSHQCSASFRDLFPSARLWRMSRYPTLLDELIGAGHATLDPGLVVGPVTTSGNCRTESGWWVKVQWNGAICDVDPVGYGADYNRAVGLAEQRYGAWGPSNDAEVTEMVKRELGMK